MGRLWRQKVIPASEVLHIGVPVVLVNYPPELVVIKKIGKM